MSTRARAKRKTGRVEGSIKRYLSGILFILMGAFITGAVSYMASIIPQQSFPNVPPPSDLYNGNYPGTPFRNGTASVSNSNSYSISVGAGGDAGHTYVIVVDTTNLGANVSDITVVIGESVNSGQSYPTYSKDAPLSYACNYTVGIVYVEPSDSTTLRWVKSVQITFNQTTTGSFNWYMYWDPPSNDSAVNNLVCLHKPLTISNSVFINFIGFAFGVVFMVAGIVRLGVKI